MPKTNRTTPASSDLQDDPALGIIEAAAYLGGMHPKTLGKLARAKQIECIQMCQRGALKFRRSALNAFLNRHSGRLSAASRGSA